MSGRSRGLAVALAVGAVAFSVVTLVVRHQPLSNIVALVIAVGSPYAPLLALSALALLALHRRLVLSIVATLVLLATVAVQAQWYYFGRAIDVGEHTDIRVLSSNLRYGHADASDFITLASESADVITVSELTPGAVTGFSLAGINDAFPYSVLIPAAGAGGLGVYSRYPLIEVSSAKREKNVAARLLVPGVRFDPFVASVHITSPLAYDANSLDKWHSSIASTRGELDGLAVAAGAGAVIVAGDFNSTPDMRQFRDLLTNGYQDAVEQTGSGFAPTFPSRDGFPPLLTIDHVLTRNSAASSIRTVRVPGSDHRALLATIKVPLDPTAS